MAYVPSGAVSSCLDRLERRADELAEAQLRHGVDVAVPLEGGACGLVEAWAAGEDWARLMANTSLDAGDVFRILRRTVDLLRQVALVPYVGESVKRRARLALSAMDRYPLADGVLTVE